MKRKDLMVLLVLLPASVSATTRLISDSTQASLAPDSLRALAYKNVDLTEVVVTGQGNAVQRRRLSSNVTKIDAKDLAVAPAGRFDQMLQTAVPNMQIQMSSSQPGTASFMKARGLSSAYLNSTPIIYIDGVRVDNLNTGGALSGYTGTSVEGIAASPYSSNDLAMGQLAQSSSISDIPMENIDHIEYVSGGAATTLYGSDAANGVIQIFTKKGSDGKLTGAFTTQLGWDVANGQFYHFRSTKDLLNKTGFEQLYRVNLSAGTDRMGFSLGAAMSQNTGIIIHNRNENKKYDLRFGSHARLNSILNYENSFGFVASDYDRDRNGNQGYYTGLWFTEGACSTAPYYYTDENGQLQPYPADRDAIKGTAYQQMKAFVDKAEALQNNKTKVYRFQTSQTFTLTPMKDLTFKGIFGVDWRNSSNKEIVTNEWLVHTRCEQEGSTDAGRITNFDRNYLGITAEINGQWKYFHEDWLSNILTAGYQYFNNRDHQSAYNGYKVADGAQIISGAGVLSAGEWLSRLHSYGFFAQDNIGILNRYYLDLGLRCDDNTAFGSNVGWQWYPKVGMSWIVSDEPFMQRLADDGIISNSRVFANYGVAGTYPPAFSYQRTMTLSAFQGKQAATFGNYGNPDLGPEKKHSFEVGFESAFFENLFTLGVTYYYTRTKDAIFAVPTLPSEGMAATYLTNVGEIENKGVEINVGVTPIDTRDWTVTLRSSFNTNHNEVTEMGGYLPFQIGGFNSHTIENAVELGKPVGFLRGTRTSVDAEGNVTREYVQDLGSTIPTFYGNFMLNVRYRDLTFTATGDYQTGSYCNDFDGMFRYAVGLDDKRVPQAVRAQFLQGKVGWSDLANYFTEKADYLKLRNIGVDYTFHLTRLFSPSFPVKTLNLAFNAYNLLSFTRTDYDPEAVLSSAQAQGAASTSGIHYATPSAARQFIFTARFNF